MVLSGFRSIWGIKAIGAASADLVAFQFIKHRCNKTRILSMKTLFLRFAKDESGVTAIEYGLIASLIAVVIITAVTLVGTNVTTTFSNVAAAL
jgi:pilus assembly protein Flp/PilA